MASGWRMNWRRLSVPSPPCVQCDAAQNRSMMKALITSAETGEKRAETSPFSSRLIAIDPTATPTENKARNSVATRSEEHTHELQSLLRKSYAFSCLNKQKTS